MSESFYVTTPLYYVNAQPHLGHAYTTVIADALARWHRQHGESVFFLTGTDEHGEKIAQAAHAQGVSPQTFADRASQWFRSLWASLGISYDRFIRTTEPQHVEVVRKVLEVLHNQGALRRGTYIFWYCVPCETAWSESDFPDPHTRLCPSCQRPTDRAEEDDYFLDLEPHRAWLIEYIETHPSFILPVSRRNEVLGMLKKALPPLCVTRPKDRVPWGIEVPFSSKHVTYVWFDALLNYLSALDWPDGAAFQECWQKAGAIHLIGKDIIRHHAVYWPIILHALKIEPPKTIFAHGWWLVEGEKMSKSKGNMVDPVAVVKTYGMDALRYFLLRDVPLGEDGIFSESALIRRINADLANDLGNLVYRSLSMLEKHAHGRIPSGRPSEEDRHRMDAIEHAIALAIRTLAIDEALKAIWDWVNQANRSIEEEAPWELARSGHKEKLDSFLYRLADRIRVVALWLWPFLPKAAQSIWEQLGFEIPVDRSLLPSALDHPIPPGQKIRKAPPLFPRIV
jgi:methionyl-tRNA synthetase